MPGGSCRFVFTLNNYTEADIEWFNSATVFKYVCYGKEVGENLTPHLQGYFELPHGNRKSINACVKYLQDYGCPSKPHIEISKGTALQAITYCEKEGTFWENGDRPKGQGKRSDIDEATDILSNGGTLQDIAANLPSTFVKFHKGLQAYTLMIQSARNWKTEVFWLWGPTGSGKSRYAWETYPDAYPKQSSTKWWCNYEGRDTAIVDDFRPSKEMPFNFILNLFDRYPLMLETKGGQVQCLLKRLIITCPFSPDQLLGNLEWVGVEQGLQLKRRIDHVIQFPQLAMMYANRESL